MRTLNEIFNEAEEPNRTERLPLEMRVAERKAMEIDYVTTRRLGQSYREQAPEKRDAVCSGNQLTLSTINSDFRPKNQTQNGSKRWLDGLRILALW